MKRGDSNAIHDTPRTSDYDLAPETRLMSRARRKGMRKCKGISNVMSRKLWGRLGVQLTQIFLTTGFAQVTSCSCIVLGVKQTKFQKRSAGDLSPADLSQLKGTDELFSW
jgi:hypothetical protein